MMKLQQDTRDLGMGCWSRLKSEVTGSEGGKGSLCILCNLVKSIGAGAFPDRQGGPESNSEADLRCM